MAQIVAYILRDEEHGVQEYIQQANLPSLKQAQAHGCTFLAEYDDGTRRSVKPEKIDLSLISHEEGINIVEQEVFVPLMNALVDLMDESMEPAIALLTLSPQKKTINSKFSAFKALVDEMNDRYVPNLEGETDGDSA